MTSLAWALAVVACFAGPPVEPGAGPQPAADSPIVIVQASAEPPAPAVAAPAPEWGPQADVASSTVARSPAGGGTRTDAAPRPQAFEPPPRPMMGIGLLVSSSVVFTAGLASRVHQVDVAMDNCRRGGWREQQFASLTGCFNFYDPPGVDSNDLFVGAMYGSSMILTMIGTGALGQHGAWQTVYGDRRARNPVARTVFGAIFAGLGVASIGAHYALIYADAQNPCTSWECNVQRRALWIVASDGGAALLNAGFGFLSWTGNYRSNLPRYRRAAPPTQWSLVPGVGRGGVGATAAVRF